MATRSTRLKSNRIIRTSCGVASHRRLVMTALTMTLLPEPVAPAISRCGILARSTACALPATSRPRAKVRVEPDALKSSSSRMRRRATILKSLFGISMPTALLPGMGASIRSDRAASAIERSSDKASIRLSLMSGAGWTSYWVTTGPAFRPTISGRDAEARQLLDDDVFDPQVAVSSPPASSGMAMSSSVVTGGRCSRCGPSSAASLPRP